MEESDPSPEVVYPGIPSGGGTPVDDPADPTPEVVYPGIPSGGGTPIDDPADPTPEVVYPGIPTGGGTPSADPGPEVVYPGIPSGGVPDDSAAANGALQLASQHMHRTSRSFLCDEELLPQCTFYLQAALSVMRAP